MIILQYRNPRLQIGLADIKTTCYFPSQMKMYTEVHQGKLHYRLRGSSKRIGYDQLKKGLVKKRIEIKEVFPF